MFYLPKSLFPLILFIILILCFINVFIILNRIFKKNKATWDNLIENYGKYIGVILLIIFFCLLILTLGIIISLLGLIIPIIIFIIILYYDKIKTKKSMYMNDDKNPGQNLL